MIDSQSASRRLAQPPARAEQQRQQSQRGSALERRHRQSRAAARGAHGILVRDGLKTRRANVPAAERGGAVSKHPLPQDAAWPAGTVFTVGHSTLPIERFLALLAAYGIEQLADVRTVPRSRRNPQFNADALRESLRAAGISYVPLARARRAYASRAPTRRTRAGATRAFAAMPTTCRPSSSAPGSRGSSSSRAGGARRSCAPRPCRGAAIARSSRTRSPCAASASSRS